MSNNLTVAVDAMSGDKGTGVIVDAVRQVLSGDAAMPRYCYWSATLPKSNRHIGSNPLPEGSGP